MAQLHKIDYSVKITSIGTQIHPFNFLPLECHIRPLGGERLPIFEEGCGAYKH